MRGGAQPPTEPPSGRGKEGREVRGKVAKRLRRIAGFKPGTKVRYLITDGTVSCGRPRSTYLKMKKEYGRA
jgi:hypothetical protein